MLITAMGLMVDFRLQQNVRSVLFKSGCLGAPTSFGSQWAREDRSKTPSVTNT